MDELQREVYEQLGTQFSLALEGMLGEPWSASLQDTSVSGDASRYLCWSQRLNIHKEPVIQVAVGNSDWREIGTKALVAVGLESPEESDVRATYLELLTQALAGLARFLTARAGAEVNLESGVEAPHMALTTGEPMQCIRLASPSGYAADLFVRVEMVVVDSIRPRKPEGETAKAAAETEQKQGQAQAQRAAAGAGAGGGGMPPQPMDLLLDVEMPVSVSFGRTQLALKDVIKLSTGSIVELNRTISEPVEVIVNNCVIARGEVVVVEGNYGVRIQQIVSRSERLRSFD
jgi:flagellar motor switch protein FliN/FliY